MNVNDNDQVKFLAECVINVFNNFVPPIKLIYAKIKIHLGRTMKLNVRVLRKQNKIDVL